MNAFKNILCYNCVSRRNKYVINGETSESTSGSATNRRRRAAAVVASGSYRYRVNPLRSLLTHDASSQINCRVEKILAISYKNSLGFI